MADLNTDIRYIKGVGEARAKAFEKLGVFTLGALIAYYPRRWEDRSQLYPIRDLPEGEYACCKAMIAQPDGLVYYIFSCEDPNEVYSLGKQTLQYYLDNNLYGYMIDTSLEGLAEQMGVPADTLAKTVEAFNAHTKAGDVDEFGRTSWAETIEGPYYVAYQRKPAAHHTMGGVHCTTDAQMQQEDGTLFANLFAAGEVTGGIHGANRLGGNAVADFTVFGRIAGAAASKYAA